MKIPDKINQLINFIQIDLDRHKSSSTFNTIYSQDYYEDKTWVDACEKYLNKIKEIFKEELVEDDSNLSESERLIRQLGIQVDLNQSLAAIKKPDSLK